MNRRTTYLLISLLTALTSMAQAPKVSLLIAGPGRDIYQLEGHAALRLTWPDGPDMAVNYGLFDFDSPNFVYRFVSGQTDYLAGAYPFRYFKSEYEGTGRSLTEYPLDLTPGEAMRVAELVRENLLPENRVYRYNYVLDNCATRPLAIVERAIATDTLRFRDVTQGRSSTFRQVMRRYHRNYPWYQFGIDLALGSGIDRPISPREMTFAPALLDEMLDSATIGASRPLVAGASVILPGSPSGPDVPAGPTPWPLTPMAVSLYILAAATAITVGDLRRRRLTRWADATLMGVCGLLGCVLTFLMTVSTHEATYPNILILWLNPLCLAVPALIFIKKCNRLLNCYEIVNFVALLTLAVIWPFSGQACNAAFIPLIFSDAILSARYIYITTCEKRSQTTA